MSLTSGSGAALTKNLLFNWPEKNRRLTILGQSTKTDIIIQFVTYSIV